MAWVTLNYHRFYIINDLLVGHAYSINSKIYQGRPPKNLTETTGYWVERTAGLPYLN